MKPSFKQVVFASMLVKSGVVSAQAISDKFDINKECIESFAEFGVKKFKATQGHDGATIFEYELTYKDKTVAAFSENYMNGPSDVEIKDKAALEPLYRIAKETAEPMYASLYETLESAADIFLQEIASAYYLLEKVYKRDFTKKLVFVDLLGNIEECMELGFQKYIPFSRTAQSPKGREALHNMYWNHRKSTQAENASGGFTVIINKPDKLTEWGVKDITPYA